MQIRSTYTQYEYNIEVYIPENINEDTPVYYILDGLSYYQYAKETIRLQSLNPLKTRVDKAIVVGICHQEKDMRARRFLDFTGPASTYTYPEQMKNNIPAEVGGAEAFYQFIEFECKPLIHDRLSFTPAREVLFGHSLGGYYALWTLLHHPEAFQAYVAISPSIWWNDYELLKKVQETRVRASVTVFIAAGEHEGFMVEDARKVYCQLHSYIEKVDFYDGKGENHASIVPHVISRAFRYISNETRDDLRSLERSVF